MSQILPTKLFLTKGLGIHKDKLASFELALRDAGIEKCNLVYVSSILPPNCKIISKEDGVKLLSPGQITFVVMARMESNEPNRLMSSAIGIAIPKDNCNKYGYLCLSGNTEIETIGTTTKIKELVGKNNFPVYSYSLNKEQIIITNVKKVFMTKKDAEVWELTLDNGEKVIATQNHQFLMRNKQYKMLKDLKPGESMMPFYRMYSNYKQPSYYIVLNKNNRRVFEHRMIMEYFLGRKLSKNEIVHHINENHLDNRFENFQLFKNFGEHTKYHHEHRSEEKENIRNKKISEKAMGRVFPEERKIYYRKIFSGKGNPMYGRVSAMKGKHHSKETKEKCTINTQQYWDNLKKNPILYQERISKFKRIKVPYNHKVMKIRKLKRKEDVYCMEVERTHNFALKVGIISKNSEHHIFGEKGEKSGEYAEDLAATMLASTLGIEFNPDTAWEEREQVYKASGQIFKTTNIVQSAEGNKDGLWTTVIASAVLLTDDNPNSHSHDTK